MKKIAIITGTREIAAEDEMYVAAVVREIIRRDFQIYVGDAKGVDAQTVQTILDMAFSTRPDARYKIFHPIESLGRSAQGLAERSSRMVREAVRESAGGEVICLAFPNKPCPTGITPARSWRTGEPPSGTWSTLALAIGLNIETWVFPIGEFHTPPFWCGAPEIFMKNETNEIHGWQCKPLALL